MNWDRYTSPDGSPIIGTLETIKAVSRIVGIKPSGEPEYEGTTDIDWDSQRSYMPFGEKVFVDENNNIWMFYQLVKVEA